MIELDFPPNNGHKYYPWFACWIKNLFEVAEAKITLDPQLTFLAGAIFYIKINGKLALIDMSDFPDDHAYHLRNRNWLKQSKFYEAETLGCPIFKRSHKPGYKYASNQYPMGPFYVSNNSDSNTLRMLLSMGNVYDPYKTNKILWTNRIYAGAFITRKPIIDCIDKNKLLPEVELDTRRMDLKSHFERHKELLGSMNISGAHFTSVDIGPIESMFMGVCVLSNDIDINLPFDNQLVGGEHYLILNIDGSNINEQLNYFYENRSICKDIGDSAYELVTRSCHPKVITNWMAQKVEEFYE